MNIKNERGLALPGDAPSNTLQIAALFYATQLHFSVFPCQEQGKAPLTLHGCKDATKDPTLIQHWWQKWPQANVAIACGKVSGNLVVLDIDGAEGAISLKELEATHGRLPSTPLSMTGKGKHYFFKSALPLKNRVRLIPGIDIRTDHGYVIAPPSIHPNGWRYSWQPGAGINQCPVQPAPTWLLRLAAMDMNPHPSGRHPSHWQKLISSGAPTGQRNQSLAELAGHLLRRNIDSYVVLEICQIWNTAKNQPPLPASEVFRTVESIAAIELRRRTRGVSHD